MSRESTAVVPDWAGRHPFPPDQKHPTLLQSTSIARIYGRPPHRIPTWMHLSTDLLTHAEFALPPGTHFEPADIHAGDELYYVLSGSVWAHQPVTGQVVRLESGDVLHIPKGAPHVSHNPGSEESRVLTFFAPRIWATSEDALALSEELPGRVVTPGRGGWNGARPSPDDQPVAPFSALGRFPTDGPWSRRRAVMTAVTPRQAALFIHGRERPSTLRIYVDNDLLTLGVMSIAAGAQSDPEAHPGDELVHVLEGAISVEVEPRGKASVSVPRLELRSGEKGFLPAGAEHCYLNFASRSAEILFAVAPKYGWGTEA